MNAASHKMSLAAIMAAARQQQQKPTTPVAVNDKDASDSNNTREQCGSISPKMALTNARVIVGVKRTRKCKRVVSPKKPRKSRVIYNFTAETLSQYFHLSQRNAAKLLGVAPITMKRNCKRQGIMWPFRAQKIEAAYRARLGSEESDAKDDNDDAEVQAVRALARMRPGGTAATTLSEAGLVFARLPYRCIKKQTEATEIAL